MCRREKGGLRGGRERDKKTETRDKCQNREIERPHPWLLFRYLFATASSRLVTKSWIKKISGWTRSLRKQSYMALDVLLSIPPASLHLLEKLGIVTALSLVDDELACEPFSTPQQLLIPASNGFTLLDICPVFDGDAYSTDDEDNNENNNTNQNNASNISRRQSSDLMSIDSDDSNEETRFNFSHSAPARTLRKIRKNVRKRYVQGGTPRRLHRSGSHTTSCVKCRGIDMDDDEVEVQFEDPQWWKHLPSLKCIGLGEKNMCHLLIPTDFFFRYNRHFTTFYLSCRLSSC